MRFSKQDATTNHCELQNSKFQAGKIWPFEFSLNQIWPTKPATYVYGSVLLYVYGDTII
jgi:hypothetical protein